MVLSRSPGSAAHQPAPSRDRLAAGDTACSPQTRRLDHGRVFVAHDQCDFLDKIWGSATLEMLKP
jgi:hypothetical protein